MKKIIKTVKVKNPLGLHARPAATIARLLQKFKSDVMITHKKETINARSMISILMLAVKKNTQVVLTAEGEDAEEAMKELLYLFDLEFEERKLE